MTPCNQVRCEGPDIIRHCRKEKNHRGKCAFRGPSRNTEKLRAAQGAADALPDGPDKEALAFAVLQWMHALAELPGPRLLTEADQAWASDMAKRLNRSTALAAGKSLTTSQDTE